MSDENTTYFINVDLEVVATQDLTELARSFEPAASALECIAVEEGYFANLELEKQPEDAETAIRAFVDLIQRLPERPLALWRGASRRDFSIGVDAGSTPSTFELALTPATLKLAADVGARIVFVVYVHDPSA